MARKLEVEIVGDARSLNRALGQAGASTGRFGGALDKLKAAGIGAGIALGTGLVVGLTKSVKAAMEFQSQMELIQTQAGASTAEVNRMSKALVKLGPSVGQTPENLAKGLYHIESAGIRGAKALQVLKTAAEGAAVGHADLESVTNALVAAQKSGIKGMGNMTGAMGSLNAIVGAGNMRMEDLTASLSTGILPAAKTFGLSITDVGAALATMTRNGVPAVDAATRLRMTFSLLAAPTSKASGELKKIGLSSSDLANTMRSRGLLAALTELKKHLDDSGMSATQTAQLLSKAFGGGRSSSALLTLIGNLKEMKNAQDSVTAGSKSFGANWEETQKTAEFATARFHASIAALEVEIGAHLLPVFTRAVNFVVLNWPQISLAVETAWAKIKPTLVALQALIVQVVATIRAHWSTIGPIVRAAGAIIEGMLRELAGAIKVITALLHGDWAGAWNGMKQVASGAAQAMAGVVRYEFLIVKAAIDAVISGIKALIGWLGHKFAIPGLDAVISAFHTLYGVITAVVGAIKSIPHDVSVHVHIPGAGLLHKIPGLAAGGNVVKSGLAMVGERGPELLSLPAGASVSPLGSSGSMAPIIVNLVLDGKVAAKALIDPLRREAQVYGHSSGRGAFA